MSHCCLFWTVAQTVFALCSGQFHHPSLLWEPHLADLLTRQCSGGTLSKYLENGYPGYPLNRRAYVSQTGSVSSGKPPRGVTQGFELDALPVLCCI